MNPHLSAQNCGCDPGCQPRPHVCEWHQSQRPLEEGLLASREAVEAEQMRRKVAAESTGQCSTAQNANQRSVAGNNPVQTGFATGATRSTSEGKIDYEGHINPDVLAVFGEFMNKHRVQRDGRLRASDNWQQGIPIYRYVKSLVRHTFEFWRMWRGTPVINPDNDSYFTFREVLSAMLFNTMGIIYEMQRQLSPYLDMSFLMPGERIWLEQEDTRKAQALVAGATYGSANVNKASPAMGGESCYRPGLSPVTACGPKDPLPKREHILTERHLPASAVRDSVLEEEGTYRLTLERERY